ncbi:hypothetical protein [Wukongibacter sp. M2B1]|uniref:hypothetical protein n=1 Tax=Wukongibacter sp. M2B1 TaxID=3088895 RepID=UPI003D78DDF3
MKQLSQEYIMDTAFVLSIEREELLQKKYLQYINEIDNKEIKNIVKELRKISREHVNLIKDLMIKLNLQG